MVAYGATGCSTKQPVMASIVASDAADRSTGDAADSGGLTRGGDGTNRNERGEGEDCFHEVSPTVSGLLRLCGGCGSRGAALLLDILVVTDSAAGCRA